MTDEARCPTLHRYDLQLCAGYGPDCTADMVECLDGDYVPFDEVTAILEELRKWKPMTSEEAEAALAAVENAPPISEQEVDRIVAFATDPANRLDNDEQTKLIARIRQLEQQLARATEERREAVGLLREVGKYGTPDAVIERRDALLARLDKERE